MMTDTSTLQHLSPDFHHFGPILPEIKFGNFCPVDMLLERGFTTFPQNWVKTKVRKRPLLHRPLRNYYFPVDILREVVARALHFTEATETECLFIDAHIRHRTFEIMIHSQKLPAHLMEEMVSSLELRAQELKSIGFYLKKGKDSIGHFCVKLILSMREYQKHLDAIELKFMSHVINSPFETVSRSRHDPMTFHYITIEDDGRTRFNKIHMKTPIQVKRKSIKQEHETLQRLNGIPGFPHNAEFKTGDGFDLLSYDYIHGEPLSKSWISHLDPDAKKKIMDQIANLLSQLSERGILHADLFPENFIADAKRNIYLTDFDQSLDFKPITDWAQQFEYSFCPLEIFLKNSGLKIEAISG
jgi:hypothetical protein